MKILHFIQNHAKSISSIEIIKNKALIMNEYYFGTAVFQTDCPMWLTEDCQIDNSAA